MSDQGRTPTRARRGDQDTVLATVVAVLPNEGFRLRLASGSEVAGHVSGAMRMRIARLLPGAVVPVQVSPFDPGRARIVGAPQPTVDPQQTRSAIRGATAPTTSH